MCKSTLCTYPYFYPIRLSLVKFLISSLLFSGLTSTIGYSPLVKIILKKKKKNGQKKH